ncbi:MAG: hypothetical protein ACPGYP_10100 [Solirubrobacterales bacterium]
MRRLLLITLSMVIAAIAFIPTASASSNDSDQRVIVELAIAANSSSQQISDATDALLTELPAGSYTVNNRYNTLPYVALSIRPSAQSVLQTSNLVAAVHRDEAVSASRSAKPGASKAGKKSASGKKKCKKVKKKGKKTKKVCKKVKSKKKSGTKKAK